MTASFSGVNLKGMEGLLSGVFRCCPHVGEAGEKSQLSSTPHDSLPSPRRGSLGRSAFHIHRKRGGGGRGDQLTTMSASLGLDDVMEKARICGLAALLAERAAVRNTKGAILLAMMGGGWFNGRKMLQGGSPLGRSMSSNTFGASRAACWPRKC